MALIKSFTLPGDVVVSAAYIHVASTKLVRFIPQVSFQLTLWKDKAKRDAYTSAHAAYTAATAAFEASKAVLDGKPGDDWTVQEKTIHRQNAIDQQAAAEAVTAITPVMETPEITLQGPAASAVMTGGAVDLAKLYAHIKTLPIGSGAQDD